MKKQKGITMIVLIITIVVILILVTTISITSGNSINNARISAFANDLKEVEDATKMYYLQNDKLPTSEEAYTKDQIVQLVPSKYQGSFRAELQENNDNMSETDKVFYKIDLSMIDVEQSTRGMQKDEDGNDFPSDVFVVVYPSMNIYYIEGMRAKGDIFFSLTSKITSLTKIIRDEVVENGSTSITTSGGILVKRENNSFTNSFDLIITTNMAEGENLYMSIVEDSRHQIQTVRGQNIFKIDNNLKKIYSDTTKQDITTGVNEQEIEKFNQKSPDARAITFTKEKSGSLIGKVVVKLTNYEIDLPVITSDISFSEQYDYHLISFRCADNTSQIDKVTYDFITKIDKNGEVVPYYEGVNQFDDNYMKTRAKKAAVSSDGLAEIKLPKNIKSVQINVFDKAGNTRKPLIYQVVAPVYAEIYESGVTTTSIAVNGIVKFSSDQTVSKVEILMSDNGVDFTKYAVDKLEKVANNLYRFSGRYYPSFQSDKILVKGLVTYGNNQTYETMKEVTINAVKK